MTGIFDSGLGGLSVARAVAEQLPGEPFVYVADSAYAPYGPRPAEEIAARSRKLTDFLLSEGCQAILVACNTATSVAIDELRDLHPGVPFVGLEPAVKPASGAGRVGVMATRATLDSERYRRLRDRYFGDRPVLEDDCAGLVALIEAEAPEGPLVRQRLREIVGPLLGAGVDTLVLGCTHYPLVMGTLKELCGPGVRLLDPAPAAARQLGRLLGRRPSPPLPLRPDLTPASARPYVFHSTGNGRALRRMVGQMPVLNERRVLGRTDLVV